ncbi:MAG: hypothetical protein RI955_1549 [Bacteroidota bacterium]
MQNYEEKRCPICASVFVCKVADVANCQCSEVTLSTQTLAYLKASSYDCLCKQCLHKIDVELNPA